MHNDITISDDHADMIAKALATEGGHLSIGRGGFTLHYARGATLSGYDCEPIKAACIAAGLPVIHSRCVDFGAVAKIAISGPMVAVGERPRPAPWHAFAYAPLATIVELYRQAGAEISNAPDNSACVADGRGEVAR